MLILGSVALVSALAAQEKKSGPPPVRPGDVVVVPFTSVAADRKLDPKAKDIFDELKATVTSGRQTRIRISGRKDADSGNFEGRPVNHAGKLVLIPGSPRSGTLVAKEPTANDVRYYHICVELPDDKLKSEHVELKKGETYAWVVKTEGDKTSFTVTDESSKPVASISVPDSDFRAFGFAATVRWKGNEADLVITMD